ncbi:MAG TPA: hypothetical protein VH599_07320 [Ktedonobacterales bacterium]|jgi:hypothetical protein
MRATPPQRYTSELAIIVENWEHTPPKDRHTITVTRGGKPVPETDIDSEKITYLIEDAGYWRKANAIHRWFVVNVQRDNDDCKQYCVSEEQIQALLDIVNKVLGASELVEGEIVNGHSFKDGNGTPIRQPGKLIKGPTVAKELLPTSDGFFFGSTNYDQFYIEDLQLTKEILEKALQKPGDYYSSSW